MQQRVVETKYGKVSGAYHNGCWSWKGVPYARAPIGELRFRPPQPPVPWNGIYEALHYSPAAMQREDIIMSKLGNALTNLDEDCLYLNIRSPASDESKRPVIVWIHGGAFKQGSGVDPWFDGTSFATVGDVVLVTINYRLSVLGFLYLNEMAADGRLSDSGNCGLLDQIAALEWVKDNIEAFGGDPNRVTIAGQSAGAQSVAALMAMPQAKGLFAQAILQSGQAGVHFATREQATAKARELLRILQIGEDELSRLQSIPARDLLDAAASSKRTATHTPVVDGATLPDFPLNVLRLSKGDDDDVKLLIGYTLEEFKLFAFEDPSWHTLDSSQMIRRFESISGPVPEAAIEFYQNQFPKGAPFDSLMRLQTFRQFALPTLRLADICASHGGTVYMYRFDWKSTVGQLGACHSQDLPFVFNTLDAPGVSAFTGDSPDRKFVAMAMHRSWIAFAHCGNPNGNHIPDWPQYDLSHRPTMLFNVECKVEHDPAQSERELWESALPSI